MKLQTNPPAKYRAVAPAGYGCTSRQLLSGEWASETDALKHARYMIGPQVSHVERADGPAVNITQPAWAAARGRFVASTIIGGNTHSAEGKTPERAALWLRVRLAGLWAYADACKEHSFAEARRASRAAMRAALRGQA